MVKETPAEQSRRWRADNPERAREINKQANRRYRRRHKAAEQAASTVRPEEIAQALDEDMDTEAE